MHRQGKTQKWLSFRRLNGALQKNDAPQNKNSAASKTNMGLAAIGVVVILCSLNDVYFVGQIPMQAMIHAVFCISAACMYILYQTMKCMVATVLSFSEDGYRRIGNHHTSIITSTAPKKNATETQQHTKKGDIDIITIIPDILPQHTLEKNDDDDDDTNNNNNNNNNNNKNKNHKKNRGDDQHSSSEDSVPDIDSWNEMLEEEAFLDTEAEHHPHGRLDNNNNNKFFETVPREVVVSSMYLGGVGAFLAIGPLCMWTPVTTLAFTISLFLVAICGNEHPPAQCVCVLATLAASTWIEVSAVNLLIHDPSVMCPHIILAAASPLLLRASSGTNKGLHYHRLSPSQTLETSLPISVVLAILVLCWYVNIIIVLRLYYYYCNNSNTNFFLGYG